MPDIFGHLPLVLRKEGLAKFNGRLFPSELTKTNKSNRRDHADRLKADVKKLSDGWLEIQESRKKSKLPDIEAGVPLLLKIDPTLDLDKLSSVLGFEVVSEEEDGFVIVASQDISLSFFQEKIDQFAEEVRGSANVADIHSIAGDLSQMDRLRIILSERLFEEFADLSGGTEYICDVSIACVGTWTVPTKPNRGKKTDEKWATVEAEWSEERLKAYRAWDKLKDDRLNAINNFITAYNGEVLHDIEGLAKLGFLPDSFSLRVKLPANGLKDFILNYPYIFEVVEPDDIELPQEYSREIREIDSTLVTEAPDETAPTVCVIDSGIQEGHLFLEKAIHKNSSYCYLSSKSSETADLVKNGGHGTRVAGAILYGEQIIMSGNIKHKTWIQNARILDENCSLPKTLYPPVLLRQIVNTYNSGERKTKIFNHSINADTASRRTHMSAWAAEIDKLSYENDVLFIQSAGNINLTSNAPKLGVKELLANGHFYPDYLGHTSSKIANPSQSLQAITVGSVAQSTFANDGWKSFAKRDGDPSAFTRCGLGIWGSIKPEVVEYGGDFLYTDNNPINISTPDIGSDCYPLLLRSTLHGGPAIDRDNVGTSFAAPKVAKIASKLQSLLPDESTLLYRGLIVQSARWPEWASSLNPEERANLLCRIGYGIPNEERATTNTDFRTTFITSGENAIQQSGCHIFQVPIPSEITRPGADYDILVEVTLSYAAEPRRTRKSNRGYLSTWLDWISNRKGESLEAFLTRALKSEDERLNEGQRFGWTIESKTNAGLIADVRRNIGTVQKDWAIVKSNALPDNLCIAVRAHRGWNKDSEASAPYSLVVTLEIVGKEIPIYEPLRTAVTELQTQLSEIETELEIDIEV